MPCQHEPICENRLQHLLLLEYDLTRALTTLEYYKYLRHTPLSELLDLEVQAHLEARAARSAGEEVSVTPGV